MLDITDEPQNEADFPPTSGVITIDRYTELQTPEIKITDPTKRALAEKMYEYASARLSQFDPGPNKYTITPPGANITNQARAIRHEQLLTQVYQGGHPEQSVAASTIEEMYDNNQFFTWILSKNGKDIGMTNTKYDENEGKVELTQSVKANTGKVSDPFPMGVLMYLRIAWMLMNEEKLNLNIKSLEVEVRLGGELQLPNSKIEAGARTQKVNIVNCGLEPTEFYYAIFQPNVVPPYYEPYAICHFYFGEPTIDPVIYSPEATGLPINAGEIAQACYQRAFPIEEQPVTSHLQSGEPDLNLTSKIENPPSKETGFKELSISGAPQAEEIETAITHIIEDPEVNFLSIAVDNSPASIAVQLQLITLGLRPYGIRPGFNGKPTRLIYGTKVERADKPTTTRPIELVDDLASAPIGETMRKVFQASET